MDKTQAVQKIVEILSAEGITPEIGEIQNRTYNLIDNFGVPADETIGSVANYFRNQSGKKIKKTGFTPSKSGSPEKKVAELEAGGKWATLNVRVIELWEPTSDTIDQTGLIADDTGQIKFTIFKKAGLNVQLEAGETYKFENVVTNLFQGRLSINVNKTSKIIPIDIEIEVKDNNIVIEGMITKVKDGSMVIKRCPECNRKLDGTNCTTHGKVEGVPAVRLMAFFDTGAEVLNLVTGSEVVEQVLGMTVDQIRGQVVESLNVGLVREMLETALIGRRIEVTGFCPDKTTVVAKKIEIAHVVGAAKVIEAKKAVLVGV